MATSRVNALQKKLKLKEDDYSFEKFKENLKRQWREKGEMKEKHRIQAQACPKILMALQCPSQLYLFLYYIIPRLFEDYSDATIVFLQLFVCFCCFEGLINYLCSMLTPNYVTKAHTAKFRPSNGHVPNGLVDIAAHDDGELPWSYCGTCEMNIPPRAHHCKVCKKCVLKRDHHCFMVGNCIGFYNQRYFFVLGFYAVFCGLLAFCLNAWYLYTFFWPVAHTWADFFPPVALFRWLFGYEDIEHHILILIFQLYPELFFGGFGLLVLNAQITLCLLGKTAHESTADLPIKNSNNVLQNFESVFGENWILNFLFPMTPCFKQKGDGTYWEGVKIDHSVKKNDVCKKHTVIEMI